TPARRAVIRAEPGPTAAANPSIDPAPANVATAGSDEAQIAAAVTSFREPSLYTAVAENCTAVPATTLESGGPTAIETNSTAVVCGPGGGCGWEAAAGGSDQNAPSLRHPDTTAATTTRITAATTLQAA